MSASSAHCALFCLSLVSFSLVAESPLLRADERAVDADLTAKVMAHRDLGKGLDGRHSLRLRREEADGLGRIHTRAQQYFRGVRVLGGELVLRNNPDGTFAPTADALARDLSLNPDPSLGASEALAIAHASLAPGNGYKTPPTAEVVIWPVTGLSPRPGVAHPLNAADFEEIVIRHELAYLVHAEIEQEDDTRHEDLLIQAHTGGLIRRWSTLHTASHSGTGKSEYSGTVTLGTNSTATGYELRDVARGGNATINMGGSTSGAGTIYASTSDSWGDGANYVATSGSTSANGQTAAVDAHYGMQVTWDFLKNVLGRNGIDGKGRAVTSRVHYASGYDNAFWSDTCFCMTYGDGTRFKTLTALDVAGHEMSHGICSTTANLAYYGESGGLNEANSDILGTMVEFYARGAKGLGATVPDTGGNWTIGEQLVTSMVPTPLRYLNKPSLDGRSPDAWSSTLASLDVHYSSGPMNRTFYFLSQGASSVTTNADYSPFLPGGMKGLGNDKALRIWWRALTTRLTSTSNYLAARNGAIASASELYGAGSPEEIAVWNAFAAINVGSAWKPTDTTAPAVSAKVSGTSGTLSFTATATDNVGVARVDYYVDGLLKGSATASPYTLAFNSASLANGTHSLVAKAADAAGNLGTSPAVFFTVSNATSSTTLQETESNDTIATANVIGSAVTRVLGTLATGTDVDTFALSLVAGQSVQLTLTPPPGMVYGMQFVQGFSRKALAERPSLPTGKQVLTIPAPPPTAIQATVYIQVYSLNRQGSSAQYAISIQR